MLDYVATLSEVAHHSLIMLAMAVRASVDFLDNRRTPSGQFDVGSPHNLGRKITVRGGALFIGASGQLLLAVSWTIFHVGDDVIH